MRAYKQDLSGFVAWAADSAIADLDHVDRELLRAYQSDLGRRPGAKPLAAPTRHRRLVALRSFLRYCAREEWTPDDLGVTIDLPKLPKRLPKPLEDQDLTNVTAGADLSLDDTGLRDHVLVAFLVSTGCRISEALAVDRVVVRGKGDVERTVVITDRTREITNRYLAARTDDAPALFINLSPGRAGRRLSVRGAEAICTRIGLRNKISGGLHPHRFRHTAGTIVQEEIGDPRLTAEFLGRHELGSVAGYTEISKQRHAQAADALRDRGV